MKKKKLRTKTVTLVSGVKPVASYRYSSDAPSPPILVWQTTTRLVGRLVVCQAQLCRFLNLRRLPKQRTELRLKLSNSPIPGSVGPFKRDRHGVTRVPDGRWGALYTATAKALFRFLRHYLGSGQALFWVTVLE